MVKICAAMVIGRKDSWTTAASQQSFRRLAPYLIHYGATARVLIKRCPLLILVCSYNLLKMLSLRQW